jgi:capsular polysaccharide export protein
VKPNFATPESADRFVVPTGSNFEPHTPHRIDIHFANISGTVTRRFLFASAPFGPFSRELAAELRARGAKVTRILLNGGDVFDWATREAIPYFGAWSGWGDWLKVVILSGHFTDIVAYGDSSPHATTALSVASELGIRSHVMEQGYFRPDWITLDAGGVNANSALPRDPAWYRNHPAAHEAADAQVVGRTTPAAVRHIVAYHLAMYLGVPFFWRYRAHYAESAAKQAAGHVARYGLQPLRRKSESRSYEDLVRAEGPVFLCVLQRPGDSQLWRHSEYASFPPFIDRVVTSFASHAPETARLVIRPHPLDPGLVPHGAIVSAAARRRSIEDRVRVTDFGKLHDVLPRMAGVVCINSTAGLAAVEFGKPTITLGRAMYDMPGLTHQGDLDGFWQAPQAPDAGLYQAFRRVVIAETQVNGAYATQRGRQMSVPEIARRLLAPART